MGKLALAAKITHVPSMYLSELPGKNHGCRQGAIDGHKEIGKRCREMGVDTIIVFDTHWLVNSAYHINCADHFEGVYTSNELPHFIRDMTYDYDGNPVENSNIRTNTSLIQAKVPVLTGGLIADKEDVLSALEAGATAISTTNQAVWDM